jgi:hypothetical protein
MIMTELKDKKAPKKALAITQAVTVVSSIPIDAHTRTRFENALNTGGINITPTYNDNGGTGLGYGSLLDAAVHSPTSGLLVTLGGLVAFNFAIADSQTKFISLIGGTPQMNGNPFPAPANGINFWGAVSLESYVGNTARIRYLGRPPNSYQPGQITLLYNPNSAMSNIEIQNWPNTNIQPAGVDPNANNSDQYYDSAFRAITTSAVVVSADPWFNQTKNKLVAAANASGLYVSYPLKNYKEANPPPEKHGATVHGQHTDDGIMALGRMANSIFQQNTAQSIQRLPLPQPEDQ